MEISNGYEGTYEISQLKGIVYLESNCSEWCSLNDVDVLKNLRNLNPLKD
jgi:hypothetical protein